METIMITDIKKYVQSSAVSDVPEKYRWRAIDYETKEFGGTMLYADPDAQAPEIEINPSLIGWYTIKIGLYNYKYIKQSLTRVKLSDDDGWVRVKVEMGKLHKVVEAFYKHADLTNQSIKIAQVDYSDEFAANIAYLKFEKLSDEQVIKIKEERKRKDTKRLLGTHDMHNFFYFKEDPKLPDFIEEVEPYRNSDFETLCFEYVIGSDNEEINDMCWTFGTPEQTFPRKGDALFSKNKARITAKGENTLGYKIMVDHAHKLGKKMYISMRMNAFASEIPFDTLFNTKFYEKNPQWHCKDEQGNEICRMSYAYPGVQDRLVKFFEYLIKETGCDGIALLGNRGFPYVMYEEPAVKKFIDKYKIDPRTLPEDDERWLDNVADVMTEYIRKLRKMLDDYSKENNCNRLNLAVYALFDGKTNRKYGFDIARWAKESLIDEVVSYPTDITGRFNPEESGIQYYVDSVKNTNVKYYYDLLPRQQEPEEYRQRAVSAYKKGVYGFAFWDTYQRHYQLHRWSMIRRLGHKNELENWDDGEGEYFKAIPVTKVGPYRVDVHLPSWGL